MRIRLSLTNLILLSLVAGFALGALWPEGAIALKPLRNVFLNGVKCIIAPLIFASIVCGMASAGSPKKLGRMGFRAIIWFEIATTAALAIGLLAVNFLRPGAGVTIATGAQTAASLNPAGEGLPQLTLASFIEHLVPHNFAEAVAKGDVLQIVIFSMVFGAAVLLAGEKGRPLLNLCESLMHVMFRFTDLVMKLAPLGVGAAMAAAIGEQGLGVVVPMVKLVGSLYLTLILFVIAVLVPGLVWARANVRAFFRELRPSLTLAFATTSSESAYPSALEALEKMGVPNPIASFVLPLGYSFNLDGSTLYLAMASVTIAQASGIDLPLKTQIAMMLTLMLTTKGVAAVPRASFVVLSATLATFGLPLEGLVLILGVDAFMDMARTAINLLGNCVATVVVARWEGNSLAAPYQLSDAGPTSNPQPSPAQS